MSREPPRPPALPRFLVAISAPPEDRAEVLGDLQERFVRRTVNRRSGRARMWYWKQAVDAMLRFLAYRLLRTIAGTTSLPVGGRRMVAWFAREIRFALRNLRRTPGFALAAILTLSLGVGANTAIFSVVNGVVLRPLPYPEPDLLGVVSTRWGSEPDATGSMSFPDIRDLQEQATSLAALAGYSSSGFTLTGMGDAEVVDGARVTNGLLPVFQLAPVLGRDILVEEAVPDGARVVLVGYSFWQERFSGDPGVLGRSIELSGRSYEIVGVAPEGFGYPNGAQLWTPLYHNVEECGRGCHIMRTVGRLNSGVTFDRAGQELSTIGARLEAEYPETNFEKGFRVRSLADAVYGDVRTGLYILLGAVGLVLLIACANVANLLLVRGTTRTAEIAVRSALGASRGGLIRQLLLEAFVLAGLGGLVGVGLARLGVAVLLRMAPSSIPRLDGVQLDLPVFAFAAGSVLLISMLFGLVPAIRVSSAGVAGALHEGGRGAHGGRGNFFRASLLVSEVAMSLILLSGAGLLLKSFSRLRAVDLGFESDNTISFVVSLPEARYEEPGDAVQFFERLEDRLRASPQVVEVGSVFGRPLGGSNATVSTEFLDRPPVPEGQEPSVGALIVTPEYLNTIRVPLIRGRMLSRTDRKETERVAVINQTMARQYYGDDDPIGKQITLSISFGYSVGGSPITIVGIVGDVRTRSISDPPVPEAYLAQAQMASSYLSVVVRGSGRPEELLPLIRTELRSMDPNLPLRNVETLNEAVDRAFGSAKFHVTLLMVFAGVAVALAAIGLYGVIAYLVTQRRREIGVRIALGAGRNDVVRLVMKQASKPILLGLGLGIAATLGASRVLNSLLYDVPARDPMTLMVVTGLLTVIVVAAVLIPAARATRIAPQLALRIE